MIAKYLDRFNWFCNRTLLWSYSAINIKTSDRLLVSFPKAGSTWVRYFLYQILCQRSDEQGISMDAANRLMPEFANRSMFLPWSFDECSRVVKTHQRYNPIFGGKNVVLIIRDPRDIIVSFYHYALGSNDYNFSGTVSDMLRHPRMGARACISHYQSWVKHAQLILTYEGIKANPYLEFLRLLESYGIERSEEEIKLAIEASDFSSMRKAQANSQALKKEFKDGHQFVRSGKTSQWRELFSPEDISFYSQLCADYKFNLYD